MRKIRVVLITLLVLVTAVFVLTKVKSGFSHADEGPTMKCEDKLIEISVTDGEEKLLLGVTARDAQDGDLTDKITVSGISKLITADTAKVTYLVFDSDGNAAKLTRDVRYTDYAKPKISVAAPLRYYGDKNDVEIIFDLTATDIIDGDISESVRISTLSSTKYEEVYSVTAQVTNSMGDTAKVKLPVIFEERTAERPEITLSEQVIYLEEGEDFDAEKYIKKVTVSGENISKDKVEINHSVDTDTPDTYWVWYTCENEGYTGISVLTVVVN